MKVVLKIACWILAIYAIYFPLTYFNSPMDKKEIKVSHILVSTKEKADDIKSQLEEGANFEELARKHSECPSAEYGGDLNFNEHGRLIPEFEKVAFGMAKREISEPFETKFGWHIAKVNEIRYFSDKENFSRLYYIDEQQAKEILNK